MVTKAASNFKNAVVSTAQDVCKNVSEFRMSTKTLHTAVITLNTCAAGVALWFNPKATIAGAIVGAVLRRYADDRSPSEISDGDRRSNYVARACLTTAATAYTVATCNSPAGTCAADCSNWVPGWLGMEGMADGAYLLARKYVG